MPSNPGTLPRSLVELARAIAGQLPAGEPVEDVIRQLVTRGWPETSAREGDTHA
jgi:hypothetical protein